MKKYKNSDVVIGYSGFILYEECYEYNENECYISDTEEMAKEFMNGCGHSDYRVDAITFHEIMNDYGCSSGGYAMEKNAYSKFTKIAEENGVKYKAEKYFGEPLMVVNIDFAV